MKRKLLFITMLLIGIMSFAQTTYYVKPSAEGGNDANEGTSWNTAFATLSKACTSAVSNDEIHIASGTFNVTAPVKEELTGKTLTIKGGYDVIENTQDYNNKTIFDGNEGATNQFMMISGSASNITLDNVKVQNCKTGGSGGAINIYLGTLSVSNSIFHNNKAAALAYVDGGAINNAGTLQVVNCVFTNNSAARYGGAIANGADVANTMTVSNSSFSGNFAKFGGGIGVRANGISDVNNSILWNNTHSSAGSGSQLYTESALTIAYNIVKGSNAGIVATATATLTMPNGEAVDAMDSDPLFTSATDLSLQASSPAIDKGNNSLIPLGITTDIIGFDRIYNTTVDLGAYEKGPSTGVGSVSEENLAFSPNPTKDFIIINVDADKQTHLAIYDLSGKLVLNRTVSGKSQIDLNGIANGVYLIRLNDTISKLIKK